MISVSPPGVLHTSHFNAFNVAQVLSELSHEGRKSIHLSPLEHPWPVCFTAAVSKVLDEAGIPNFVWGDLLNAWRGNPHIPNICGFVVPTEGIQKAIDAIAMAGLPVCSCESFEHLSNPESLLSLPIHFCVPQEYGRNVLLFLCPNDVLLNLIPLTSARANPASLQYDRIRLSLHNELYFSQNDNNAVDPISSVKTTHVTNVLTTASLIKAWLLLDVLSAPHRVGFAYTYSFLLHLMAPHAIPEGPYDFESKSLQTMWEKVYIGGDWSPETFESLQNEVRLEWEDLILGKDNRDE